MEHTITNDANGTVYGMGMDAEALKKTYGLNMLCIVT